MLGNGTPSSSCYVIEWVWQAMMPAFAPLRCERPCNPNWEITSSNLETLDDMSCLPECRIRPYECGLGPGQMTTSSSASLFWCSPRSGYDTCKQLVLRATQWFNCVVVASPWLQEWSHHLHMWYFAALSASGKRLESVLNLPRSRSAVQTIRCLADMPQEAQEESAPVTAKTGAAPVARAPVGAPTHPNPKGAARTDPLHCAVCGVRTTSQLDMAAHLRGQRHRVRRTG